MERERETGVAGISGAVGLLLPRHPVQATSAAARRRQEAVYGGVLFMMRVPREDRSPIG
jgi:hypothetical protein